MKKILVLSMFFILLYAVDGFSEIHQDRKWSGDLGIETSYIKYKEPGVMEEDGIMHGLNGSFSYHISSMILKIEGRFSSGQVDYKNSGTLDDIDDYLIELRALGGHNFSLSDMASIMPYIGLGYRYLNDDSSGMTTSTGAKGYERESNYYYSPIGVETRIVLGDNWAIKGIVEYDYFLKGIQKSNLKSVNPSFNNLENDQNSGYGVRGSLRFERKGGVMDFAIEPYIAYWDIKQSENANITYAGVIVGYGYEPKNNSTEAGLKFMAMY